MAPAQDVPMMVVPAPSPPTPLPGALTAQLVQALRSAALGGRPPSPAVVAALATLDRAAGRRGMAERLYLGGLRAAARGEAGNRAWTQAARSLQALHHREPAGPRAELLASRLADLQAARGLPDFPWRDRALDLRLDRARGGDGELEAAVLASLQDHWGGWLEAPRRERTLARCGDLASLWLRRPAAERARAMGRAAFGPHAGELWAFAAREGEPDLRDRLRACLEGLEGSDLMPFLGAEAFLAWVRAVVKGPLAPPAMDLVRRLDPLVEERWGAGVRAALLQAAAGGPGPEIREVEGAPALGRLLSAPEEAALREAFASGRPGAIEALLWPKVEALARGEGQPPASSEELEALPFLLVEPWLRVREPEEARRRLERLEGLLFQREEVLSTGLRRTLEALRSKTEREARLMDLLGPAAGP